MDSIDYLLSEINKPIIKSTNMEEKIPIKKEIWVSTSDISGITGYNKYQDLLELTYKYIYKGNQQLENDDINRGLNLNELTETYQVEECLKLIDQSSEIKGLISTDTNTSLDLESLNEQIKEKINEKSFEISNPNERNLISELISSNNIEQIESIKSELQNSNNEKIKKIISEDTIDTDSLNSLLESKTIDTDQVNLVKNQLCSQVNRSFGIRKESPAIYAYTRETGNRVTNNNDTLHRMNIKLEDNTYVVCGKIDGLTVIDDNKILIEVKNRKSRIFKNIPYYDQVQTNVYMKMLNLQECDFIQSMVTSRGHKINIQRLKLNPLILESVFERLSKFILFIYSLRNSIELRTNFIKSNQEEQKQIISDKCYWYY